MLFILLFALIALAALLLSWKKTGAARRFWRVCAALIALSLLLEGGLFQLDYFSTRNLTPKELPLESAVISENSAEFTLDEALYRVDAVFSGPTEVVDVTFHLRDGAHAESYAAADTCKVNPGGSKNVARALVQSNGSARALRIDYPAGCTLVRVTLNAPQPYAFNLLRFFCLLLPLLFLSAVLIFKLHLIVLDRKNPSHALCYLLTCALCLMLCLWVSYLCTPYDTEPFPYTKALEYPFENRVYQYRSLAHAVMYDALAKGQPYIDEPVDERLLDLANPYDPTQREASGAEVMFDYALYEGKYYAYFGLAPVLTFYAPFRLIMGYLPAYTTAAAFFALLSMLACFLCVWELSRRFVKSPSLLLLCLTAAAAALGSNILMIEACADRYYLAIAAMQAYFFLSLWAGLRAVRAKARLRRTLWFALCAVFTFLTVWSRATGALAAAGWLVPLFVMVLLNKKQPARRKLFDALSYLVPLMLGALVIMAWNAARFGSPFEFGQTWQLTLEDIHYNRLSLRDIPKALYYFFFDGLHLSPEFPFLLSGTSFVNHSGNWFYGVANSGALVMPVTWGLLLLFCLPDKKRRGKMFVYLSAMLITLPLAAAGYAVAGAAQRYVCDIQPTLCLVGGMVLLEAASLDLKDKRSSTCVIACALCCATFLVALSLVFSNYRNFVMAYAPDKYLSLFNAFTPR